MPTRKIADLPAHERCTSREHNPPGHMVFAPGIYEHECPECGHVTRFTVRNPVWRTTWDGDLRPLSEWQVSYPPQAHRVIEAGPNGRSPSTSRRRFAGLRWCERDPEHWSRD